jgi:carboxylate-amine ligase
MFDPITIGVEEEFLVVDGYSGDLVPRAKEVLAAGPDVDPDLRIMGELNLCQLETDTTVCTALDDLGTELDGLRARAARQAAEVGAALLPTATHPFSAWEDQAIDEATRRYAEMAESYQLIAQEHVICGCHVHVGLPSRALELPVMGRTLPWLGVLLALSVNSPFWQGADSGYESYRSQIWQRWPTAGFPPDLYDRDDYEAVLEDLRRAEVVRTPKDIYWYVRPSGAHPTLEFRMCDVPLRVEDTVTIAGLVRGLAWVAASTENMPSRRQSRDLLDAGIWRAARFGLQGELIDPIDRTLRPAADVAGRLLDVCGPGLDAHGDRDAVERGVARILDRGTGAAVQRQMAATHEPDVAIRHLRFIGGTAEAPPAEKASRSERAS